MSEDLNLLPLNHPMLKVPPNEFDFENEDAHEFAESIWNKQNDLGGVGLSANQVGRNAKVFTMGNSHVSKRVLFNPELVSYSEEQETMMEGCLSAPGIQLMVTRPTKCSMSYKNESGEIVLEEFNGMWARVALHEYDHMIGQNFTGRVSKFKLERAIKKARKYHKRLTSAI